MPPLLPLDVVVEVSDGITSSLLPSDVNIPLELNV
jgi:hypothetical protein